MDSVVIISMGFQSATTEPHVLNDLLCRYVKVIEQRSRLKIKVRLWINYIMENIVFLCAALRLFLAFQIDIPYLQVGCLALKTVICLLSIQIGILNTQILSKLAICLGIFCAPMPIATYCLIALTPLYLFVDWIYAFSGQQRRGNFDQRLDLWIPFWKQMLVEICGLLSSKDGQSTGYMLILLLLGHLLLCNIDQLYNFQLKKQLIGISFLTLYVCSTLVLMAVRPSRNSNLIIAVCCLGLMTVIWLVNLRKFSDYSILQQSPGSFTQWEYEDYFNKMLYLLQMASKQRGSNEILRGFYHRHVMMCNSAECPIKYSHELDKQSESKTFFLDKLPFIQKYLVSQMEIASIKYPSLKHLFIFYISPSITALKYCDRDVFIEYRERLRIEDELQSKHIEFRSQKSRNLREEIKQLLQGYLDKASSMWRLLYDDNVDLARLENLGCELLQKLDKLKQLEGNKCLDEKASKLIHQFRKFILEEPCKEDFRKAQQQSSLYDEIHSRPQPILVMSAQPQSLSKIVNVNAACCRFLGYSRNDLLQKNLPHILPAFITTPHHKLLSDRSRQILYAKQKNLKTLVYAVCSSGYLSESKLGIMQLNSISGRKWTCIFEPTYNKNCILMTDEKNVLQGLTAASIYFGLTLQNIGKQLDRQMIQEMESKPNKPIPLGKFIDSFQEADKFTIKLKDTILLEGLTLKTFQIQPVSTIFAQSQSLDEPEPSNPFQMCYNFPMTFSNVDEGLPISIKPMDENHHEFVNYGEGISEMRYWNGQIGYKEDHSESSFQQDITSKNLVEAEELNMRKETYLEVLEISRKNMPKPLFQLNIWLLVSTVVLAAMAIGSFVIFWQATIKDSTAVKVIGQLHLWFYRFLQLTSEALEINNVKTGIWPGNLTMAVDNASRHLTALAESAKILTQLQPQLNEHIVNTRIFNVSIYDAIAQFKLSSSNLMSNTSQSTDILYMTNMILLPGFRQISERLHINYEQSLASNNMTYLAFLIAGCSICLIFLVRTYFINRALNIQKSNLLGIFLEVQEATVKKLLDRNNRFKMTVKFDKQMIGQDVESEDNKEDSDDERSARKRVKRILKVHYFLPLLILMLIPCFLHGSNMFIEKNYEKTVMADINQLRNFQLDHFSAIEAWLQYHRVSIFLKDIPVGMELPKQILAMIDLTKEISAIYNSQMDVREEYLRNLNLGLVSKEYSEFFVEFWVGDGCKFIKCQSCRTDFNGIFQQGVDQIWSLLARKLDSVMAAKMKNQNKQEALLPIRSILTYYHESIIVQYVRQAQLEAQRQIDRSIKQKIILLACILSFLTISLMIFVCFCVSRMRRQIDSIQRMVGMLPFKQLVEISPFKRYIRKKYESDIY